jgi:glycosyltransferase involved in cell wall biosynthesis
MAKVNPEISVLMTARNAADTIVQAVQSILDQTMGDFELLVYDDASEDDTVKMVEAISDLRIRLIRGREHKGIPAAWNILLREAKARYIAWLDADDLAFPQRLERQWKYLEIHREADLLFSWIAVRNSVVSSVCMPADGAFLRAWLMFRNPFAHSTLMARNFFAREGLFYDETMARAQDYELYLRLAPQKQFALLPEILVSYDARHGAAAHLAEPYLPGLLQRNLKAAGIRLNEDETSRVLHFLRNNQHVTLENAELIAAVLTSLLHNGWPVPASASHKKQLLLRQWFRLFHLCSGRMQRKAIGKVLRAGPRGWWGLWKKRVRYGI